MGPKPEKKKSPTRSKSPKVKDNFDGSYFSTPLSEVIK